DRHGERRRPSHGAQFEVNTPLHQSWDPGRVPHPPRRAPPGKAGLRPRDHRSHMSITTDSASGPDVSSPPRYGFADAVAAIRALLADRARAVELYGASGSLGAAIAAATSDATLLYVVPDEETAETRASDLEFFLPAAHAGDDPLAPPPVLELAAPDSSPYADVQADRRTTLRRMAALFRLSQGFAPRVLVASAAALFPRGGPLPPG